MKNVSRLKSQAGFSLVELMVVVAIIGILASLAIPSVGKYMAKARQSEAKTQLSSLYTAEKAFFAEYTVYDSRFGAIGYSPEGKLRYVVGFTGAGTQATAANGYTVPAGLNASVNTVVACPLANSGCLMLNGATNIVPAAGDMTAANCPASASGVAAGCLTGNTAFQAAASAVIHTVGTMDRWRITSNKELDNTNIGIP